MRKKEIFQCIHEQQQDTVHVTKMFVTGECTVYAVQVDFSLGDT